MNGFASPVRRRRGLQLTASLPLLPSDDSHVCASPKITQITGSIR